MTPDSFAAGATTSVPTHETRPPRVWTGRGLSWSVAVATAAELRALGHATVALTIAELMTRRVPGTVAMISRSGQRPSNLHVDVLVTETGDCSAVEAIRVDDTGDQGYWLPLDSARATLDAILLSFGLSGAPTVDVGYAPRSMWIYPAYAEVARTVFRAAGHKTPELVNDAVDCDDVGHGLHSSLLRGHPAVTVRYLDDGVAWRAMDAWCLQAGVGIARQESLTALRPAAVFAHAIGVLKAQIERAGIDVASHPLSDELDWLRSDRPRCPSDASSRWGDGRGEAPRTTP
jgi:hypothetical protein